MAGQALRGLLGQSMNGQRPGFAGYLRQYPPGNYTLKIPASGIWTFVLWGGGGDSNNNPGGGGALAIVTRSLNYGQLVSIIVGGMAASTVVTLPNGEVVTAGGGAQGGGSPGAGGTATGGDINVSGGTSSTFQLGGDAASWGDYLGGLGGPTFGVAGASPGGGQGGFTGTGSHAGGGSGLALAFLART